MRGKRGSVRWGRWWLGALLAAGCSAYGAVITTVDFNSDEDGWTHQAGGPMAFSYAAGFGVSGGSLQGTFAEQSGLPSTETDAFRAGVAASGGSLTGNYWDDVPNFSSWTFNFYADDVLPSDIIVRFGNGVTTFMRNVLPQVTAVDAWLNVTVPLTYAGWFGGSANTFSNVLGNVTYVEVQFSRNGTGIQNFYLDNFALNGSGGGGPGGGGTAVPEPGTGLWILGGMGVLGGLRRRTVHRVPRT